MPSDARGVALVEIPDAADAQEFPAPDGVEVRWLARSHHERPGALAYRAAAQLELPADVDGAPGAGSLAHAYAVGESSLATGIRRLLVNEHGWAKTAGELLRCWRLRKGARRSTLGIRATPPGPPRTPPSRHTTLHRHPPCTDTAPTGIRGDP